MINKVVAPVLSAGLLRLTFAICLLMVLITANYAVALETPGLSTLPSDTQDLDKTNTSVSENSNTWDLSDLYGDTQNWQRAFEDSKLKIATLTQCRGTLSQSATTLSTCLDRIYDHYRQALRVYTYAFLGRDTDLANSANGERYAKAQSLLNEHAEAISFLEPELISIGGEQLNQWLSTHSDLSDYRHFILNTLRKSRHVLSPREEEILAAASDPLDTISNTYSIFTNAELPWPEISLTNDETVVLNPSNYVRYRGSKTRADRKIIFDTFFDTYQGYRETLASTLSGEVKRHVFSARMRGFDSSLQQAMDADNIPEEVYLTLVSTVNNRLDTLHRYMALRAKWMEIDDLRYYDVYPSVVENDKEYSLEDSKYILSKAIEPLGSEYEALLNNALSQNWTHPYPAKGKRSGAYVMGAAYDVHPYMLLNHNNSFGSLSTFAHEWGHGIHTLLSNAEQAFPNANYPTFIAEIASTANEVLLFNYLRSNARNDEERLFYLWQELQGLRGTFFRQTQFAEFELAIHQEVERGEALSGEKLNRIYGDILKHYYGHDKGVINIDPTYHAEWAYIPHFYRNFYVYQYATSISAAYYLVDKMLKGGEAERQEYLAILKAGGSDYPYDILKRAGVDMASPEVYLSVIQRFEYIMDEIETLQK